MEYISAELLERSGNERRDRQPDINSINIADIENAVRDDEELARTFESFSSRYVISLSEQDNFDSKTMHQSKAVAQFDFSTTQSAFLEGGSVVLEEELPEDYEPTEEEILEYASWIEMDVEREKELFWIAREGLKMRLPEHVKPCKTNEGEIYYFNFVTGHSVWDHPCDTHSKFLYEAHKLVREFNDANSQQQASAATALIDFCLGKVGSEMWQDACGRAGVLAALLQSAKIDDSQIQKNAIIVLGDFVENHEANQSAAGSSGAITVVQLLTTSSDIEIQKASVFTLGCLVNNHEANRSAAGSSGAIAALSVLMKSGDAELQALASKTLGYLVDSHETNQSAADALPTGKKSAKIEIANDEEDVRAYAKVCVFIFYLNIFVSKKPPFQFLGLDLEVDTDLMWIAVEGLSAPLPDGWSEHVDDKGNL
jgi:centrosomal protein CEP164